MLRVVVSQRTDWRGINIRTVIVEDGLTLAEGDSGVRHVAEIIKETVVGAGDKGSLLVPGHVGQE